jgi:DNA replication protein DnaC
VVFLGPPGVGKTHLAVALGMAAIHTGMQVYFINPKLRLKIRAHIPIL